MKSGINSTLSSTGNHDEEDEDRSMILEDITKKEEEAKQEEKIKLGSHGKKPDS